MSNPTPRRARAIAAGLLVALTGGCAGLGGPSAPTPIASLELPAATPYEDLAPMEIRIPGDPDTIGVGFDAVWVKADAGTVTRIDPATATVAAELQIHGLDDTGCNGIGVGASAVWSCEAGGLVRIDPATGAWDPPAATHKVWSQLRLVEGAGRIWVLDGDGSALVGMSEADGSLSEPITLPAACTDVGAAGDFIYVVCEQAGRVVAVDPAAGSVVADIAVTTPWHVSAAPDSVWVASGDGLLQLEPRTLATRRAFAGLRVGSLGAIRADDDGVLVRRIEPFLTRIDATTGTVAWIVDAPHDGGGDIAVEGDHLWATFIDEGVLVRLDMPPGT